jgi:hypothetical protein
MFNNSGYSLADIAAATGRNNDGFGGDGWWIILLFLFTGFGWGGNGMWGGGANGGRATTREEISYGFDMNGLENGIRGIQQGLCDGFYAMNTGMLNGFNSTQNTLAQGFAGINQSITNATIADMQHTNLLENGVQAIGTQLAACCCDIRSDVTKGFADLGYALATQECATRQTIADSTRDIIASNEAGTRAILDFLTQDKIAALTAENQTLKFAASQQAQNAYLVGALKDPCPVPAYVVPNPNCCYTPVANACGGHYYGF